MALSKPARADAIAFVLLCVLAALLWLPALLTPYWGDDYLYLYGAHAANAAQESWLRTFWPASPLQFWRPLSQEAWWRVVDAAFAGNVLAAHVANLLFHLLAAAGVGVLARTLALACAWEAPRRVGLLAGGVYAILALGLLPVHWASAANNPLLVLFTTLALAAWLHAAQTQGAGRMVGFAVMLVLFALSLLVKESAVLTPALLVLVSFFAGLRWRRGEMIAFAASLAVAALWLALRSQVTENSTAQYGFVFGGNLLRNAASLCAWLLNVPREALRMLATGEVKAGALWAAACALPMVAAWVLALRGGSSRLALKQWGAVAAFVLLAYAPYFPLAWNSYAYYAAVAAILPAIALARLLQGRGVAVLAALLIGASSLLAVEGTRRLDHPGLIGRARWAEAVLRELETKNVRAPLHLSVDDDQRFYAIGQHGLAWRLHLRPEDIARVEACTAQTPNCLRIEADGSWSLR
ncbi:MAG: hypothetical protein QM599_09075 [Pseudoxanthomonas sp.]